MCLAGDKALAPPAPCTDERATACAMFVERSNGSSSNYHHSNYRITPSTKCVQETKCISLDTSWALGTDSREQALPSLAGLPRHCFQESQRLRSDWSSPVPPVPSSPLSSTLYPLYTQLPNGLCSFLLPAQEAFPIPLNCLLIILRHGFSVTFSRKSYLTKPKLG